MKQFSLRDLFFLFLVVALALGWWLDHRPVAARFQLKVSGDRAWVIDTATGQVWSTLYFHSAKDNATDLTTPKLPD